MSPTSIHHQSTLSNTIQSWIEECQSGDPAQDILRTTLETIMRSEREAFFQEKDDTGGNKKNGHYARMAKMLSGVFDVRVPRDRTGQFTPLILEIIKQDQEKLNSLAFSLYTKGLSTRDINEVLAETYGMHTTPQYISNITASMEAARDRWMQRQLNDFYYAIYIDALHLPIRRDTVENEAVYIVMGLNREFKREILGIYSIPQESAAGWRQVLTDLGNRGVRTVGLFVADGLTGLENAVAGVFPNSRFQKCVVHLKRNILRNVRARDKEAVAEDLRQVFELDDPRDTETAALQRLDAFTEKWRKQYPRIERMLGDGKKQYYFTYLVFPAGIRRMIYTTNWIERLNESIRKTLKNRNSMPGENSVLTLVWAVLMEVEEKRYTHPVTAFYESKDALDEIVSTRAETQEC